MLGAARLMRHPPGTELTQHRCFAPHGQLARPLPIHAQAERAPGDKWQIDQFDPELIAGLEVGYDYAVVRLGTRHASFYESNPHNTSHKSKMIVHDGINPAAY